MKNLCAFLALMMLASAGRAQSDSGRRKALVQHSHAPEGGVSRVSNCNASAVPSLTNALGVPLPPSGVTDLKFSEIFQPIGPRGLVYTDKLKSLDGKKVRILGYMIRQSEPVPNVLLLASMPLKLNESEYGFAEDLPATIVHVVVPQTEKQNLPYTPGMLLLTGTLNLGTREEADGRISSVRLVLDPPTPDQRKALTAIQKTTK